MAFKLVVLLATIAYASAGNLPLAYTSYAAPAYALPAAPAALSVATPAALTSQSSNIYRSFGNLGQVSTYSKTIDTPYSSVSKADVRVSNPGVRLATHTTYAAPGVAVHAAPATIAHAPLLGVAYSAAPAVSHIAYTSGFANYAF
nr:unnamed protein product [Callosobruchus analis]